MNYEVFVEQVQQHAGLSTSTEAADAVRATLQTLGKRLAGTTLDRLAAQLPRSLSHFLYAPTMTGQGHSLSLQDFYSRVQSREGTELADSMDHAKVVITVLCQCVPSEVVRDVLYQLPREYRSLFDGHSLNFSAAGV